MSKSEAELLKEWFGTQHQYRTWNELADYLGIDYRVMSHYQRGTRRVVNPDHRALLFKATNIMAYASEKPADLQAPPSGTRRPRAPSRIAPGGESEEPLVLNGVTLSTRGELSAYLREWLAEQPAGTTITSLRKRTKIPKSTFSNYFSGHGFPGDRNRAEFVSLIEGLTPPDQKITVKVSAKDLLPRKFSTTHKGDETEVRDLLDKIEAKFQQLTEEVRKVQLDRGHSTPRTPREHADKLLELLYSLDRELQYFRNGSPSDREQLRRVVHGQDVGYITSLLKALYDEDKFQSWQLFANYQMVSRGEAGRGGGQ